MAATLSNGVLDALLSYISGNCENLYICNAQPTTFAEASTTYKIGTKASPSFTGPADDTSGRKVTLDAITDGTVSATDTATWFALTDDSLSELLLAQELSSSQGVSSGNTFTLTASVINVPDPTA